MKSEEKFDKIVRNVIKDELLEKPSSSFTDTVMDELGIRKVQAAMAARPILSLRSKIVIGSLYVLGMALIMFFTKGSSAPDSKYLDFLSKIKLPSFSTMITLNSQFITVLIVLIGGGWMLLGLDRLIKKFFAR